MTLNDRECPIHLKGRLADGTSDVSMLFVVAFRALTASDKNVANELVSEQKRFVRIFAGFTA